MLIKTQRPLVRVAAAILAVVRTQNAYAISHTKTKIGEKTETSWKEGEKKREISSGKVDAAGR